MKFIHFLICPMLLFVFFCLPVTASAHSGRTDSNGGHTNSQTGEYHYHHGYPAHQHYDMNGDGKPDCPYEFDDKTDHTSSNSSKNSHSDSFNKAVQDALAKQQSSSPATTTQKKSNDRDFFDIVGDVLGFAFLGFLGFVIFLYRKK